MNISEQSTWENMSIGVAHANVVDDEIWE